MTEYITLDKLPLETVRRCFLEAFGDYFVKIAPGLEDFRRMNALRGVDYSVSMGVLEDGVLAGFTLSGVGNWRGLPTAYDAGTAVLKSSRGRGYSTGMFHRLKPLLKGRGIGLCLLEVIDGNQAAKTLYEKLGFRVTRRFVCQALKAGALRAGRPAGVEITDVPLSAWPALRAAMEGDEGFLPSWQNSWDSLRRLPDGFVVKAAWFGGEPAGYGVVAPAAGSMPQLWVRSGLRGRGIGSALIAGLAGASRKGGALSWVNIDETRADVLKFLKTQ
ncbi:MAG: GNAT family N-acetyltransferase, partial [Nitrospiraceae bacterium]|nr:GNAT family N-acetyltransferase [Nitrospiraceae bacterium]